MVCKLRNANLCESEKKLCSSPIVIVQEEGEGEDADREDDGSSNGSEEEEEEEEGDGPGESSPLIEQGIIKTVDSSQFYHDRHFVPLWSLLNCFSLNFEFRR